MATLSKYDITTVEADINAYQEVQTAGGTYAVNDFVKMSSGKLIVCAEDDTTCYGMALTSGSINAAAMVLQMPQLVSVVIPYTGSAPSVGLAYGMDGTTGAQVLDQTDVSNKLFVVHEVDTVNALARVSLYTATFAG